MTASVPARLLTASALAVLGTACSDVRDRPLPLEASAGVQLAVQVIASGSNSDFALAGRTMMVRVIGSEANGRLTGVGYRIVRSGASQEMLDSAAVHFSARSDTVVAFQVAVPDTMPNQAQLNVFGIAFGPGATAQVSVVRPILVLRCTAGSTWC